MKKLLLLVSLAVFMTALVGCAVQTKLITRERVDQDLTSTSGNRGYLIGNAPAAGERKTTRDYFEVQVEVPSIERENRVPKKVKEAPAPAPATNFGPSVSEPAIERPAVAAKPEFTEYKVQKGDTLQKISMKFYGTTKKWKKLFEINKEVMKSPDKIHPGMVLKIPAAGAAVEKESEFIK